MDWRAEISLLRGETQSTQQLAAAALAFATEHGLPLWTAIATIMHGWALSEREQSAQGIAQVREGLSALERAGDRLFRLYYVTLLAEALARAGQRDEALAAIEAAIEGCRKAAVPYWDSELQRLRGELLLAKVRSEAVPVETCFRQAIEIAQAQSAKSLELRAATSLARLWRDKGKRSQAHNLLAPVYGWFTEGLDTADLKDAKALLDELA
jgi:predicted ATPase